MLNVSRLLMLRAGRGEGWGEKPLKNTSVDQEKDEILDKRPRHLRVFYPQT